MGTSSPAQQAENEAKASSAIVIDESEPVTNIQIRLADGGRLVQKFNHSHRYEHNREHRQGINGPARQGTDGTSVKILDSLPKGALGILLYK